MILYKYQAAGNDFILCYSPDKIVSFDTEYIIRLCDRRLGIGADGLIIIGNSDLYDFSMRFYNNDGSSGMMCGNGGRCAVDFAMRAGIMPDQDGTFTFDAPDGVHRGKVLRENGNNKSVVELLMSDICNVQEITLAPEQSAWRMNTGAEHLVVFVKDISETGLMDKGRMLRYDERFAPKGVNVDFVQVCNNDYKVNGNCLLRIRTYEKGVEAETLSCGTGVVASAIAAYKTDLCRSECDILTTMNRFQVKFDYRNGLFSNIWLTGDTELVFKAEYPADRIF